MTNKALVVGVGMVPFTKPGKSESYIDMGAKAARQALDDSGVSYNDVGQIYAGYVYGDSTCGQSVVYEIGLSGRPIVNRNNNCATGSDGLFLARQAVESGSADVALAVGFEQMNPGALTAVYRDREPVMGKFITPLRARQKWESGVPGAAQYFGGAGREHQERYGTRTETFAKVSEKARRHALNNPLAVFRDPLSVGDILQSPHVYAPLTRYQCCPPTCGAAASVIVSSSYAKRHGLSSAVEISAQAMTTDTASTFDPPSMIKLVGYDMAKAAADMVYKASGIGPEDISVVELHDCF